eukprot:356023_1
MSRQPSNQVTIPRDQWKIQGEDEDGVYMATDEWMYANLSNLNSVACWNPNTMSLTSSQFMNLFETIECVQLNRAPALSCSEFVLSRGFFDDKQGSNHEFICEKASIQSGYGEHAVWFVQGFTFNMAKEDALISLHCCLITGTVYDNETVTTNNNKPIDDSWPKKLNLWI